VESGDRILGSDDGVINLIKILNGANTVAFDTGGGGIFQLEESSTASADPGAGDAVTVLMARNEELLGRMYAAYRKCFLTATRNVQRDRCPLQRQLLTATMRRRWVATSARLH